MVKDYSDWKERQNQADNPDLKCLKDLLFVIKQYLNATGCKSCKSVLDTAIECTEKWIKEKES